AQEQLKLLDPAQRELHQATEQALREASDPGEAVPPDVPDLASATFGWPATERGPAAGHEGPDPELARDQAAKLTDAERRVPVLAARGLTNNQIAGRLYVTVSTVEQHLTRVYRKLRVECRDHLPSRLFVEAVEGT